MMMQPQRHDGNLKGTAQLSNYDLLNKPWVPDWFKTEQIFTMPQNQLREGLIHLRCLQMFENGEQIGEKMLHAMKTTNEKNQTYHQQHAREPRMQHMHPLSPAGGRRPFCICPRDKEGYTRDRRRKAETTCKRGGQRRRLGAPGAEQTCLP